MMKRTQIYLDENLLTFLAQMSREKKTTVSDLVRQALEKVYRRKNAKNERLQAFKAARGLWQNRSDLPPASEYIRTLRKDSRSRRLGLP